MSEKYFSDGHSEISYHVPYWKDYIELMGLSELKLYEQRRDLGSGYMWCTQELFMVEKGDGSCGENNCKYYRPRNHKNGRCYHLDNTLTNTGRIYILTKDSLKMIKKQVMKSTT